MARGELFGNLDVDIYFSSEEFKELGFIKIKDKKISHLALELMLEREGSSPLKAVVQKQEFDDLGDGIKVERTEDNFSVAINQKGYDRIAENSKWGTRYDSFGSKINLYVED